MKPRNTSGGLVYSTESGRMCPGCRQPVGRCACSTKASRPVSDGIVRVSRETGGRAGKAVTVIKGLPLDAASLAQLATQLKTFCGTGGTAKDGVVELQGDHRDKVIQHLVSAGWVVKRAGG
jgi:translation initiation factor 1